MRWFAMGLLVGCAAPAKSMQPLSNATHEPTKPTTWQLSLSGLAPLDSRSEATEQGLQAALPALRVKTNDLGEESGIVFDVFDGSEKLFYVVPDEDEPGEGERHHYARTIYSIFATSPRVVVAGHRWRVGQPLDDTTDLVACECWGAGEVTACSMRAHLSVIFGERCELAEKAGAKAMLGKRIDRIMWKRVAND